MQLCVLMFWHARIEVLRELESHFIRKMKIKRACNLSDID